MVDRESVINELVEHIEGALSIDSDYVDCVRTDLLQAVVGLLKEQEPVRPKKWVPKGQVFARVMGWYCPKCDAGLSRGYKYCHNCGQAVKWDE